MDLGISLLWTNDPLSYARQVEVRGFDYIACGEHIVFHGPVPNAFVVLAAIAGATERVRLLSSVTLLAHYPPALAAKMTAMLDVVSNGRFNLGVGIGGEFPKEFEAAGVPVDQRASRTNEGLEVVRMLLTESDVSWHGRYSNFSGVTLDPRPVQRPRPPIWIAGRRESAMRRAAKYGDYWMPYMYTPEQLRDSLETIHRFSGELELQRSDPPVRGSIFTFVTLYPDARKARRIAAEIVGKTYEQDFSTLVNRYLVAGSAQECRSRLEEYRQAGAEVAHLRVACPDEDIRGMIDMLAEEVLPEFR
jgi:probable F420-dependent oxidoreductase